MARAAAKAAEAGLNYFALGVGLTGASKTGDSLLCFGQTALSYEPPRRLGCNEDQNGERSREHPLKSDGDSNMTVSTVLLDGLNGS